MTAALLLLAAQTMAAPLPEVKLEKLKEIAKKLPQRCDKLQAELAEAEKEGFFSREDAMIRFRILLREIDSFEKDVSIIQLEIHRTERELFRKMKGGEDWERFTAIMNSLPGPGLPLNHALPVALHEKFAAFPLVIRRSKVDLKALREAIAKDKGIIAQRQYVEVLKKKIKKIEMVAQPAKLAKLTAPYRRELISAEDFIRRRIKELRPRLMGKIDRSSSTAKKWERYELLQELIFNFGPPMEVFKRRAARLRD
jgi:hypothetical protein